MIFIKKFGMKFGTEFLKSLFQAISRHFFGGFESLYPPYDLKAFILVYLIRVKALFIFCIQIKIAVP